MNILLINDYLEAGGAEIVFRYQYDILKHAYNVEMYYAYEQLADRKSSPLSFIYSFNFKKKLKVYLENRHFDYIILHNYNNALSPSILDVLHRYKQKEKCKILYYAHDFHLVCPNRGYTYFKGGKMINFTEPPKFSTILTKRLDYRGAGYSILKKLQWTLAYVIGKKQNVFDRILTPSDYMASQIKWKYPEMEINKIYNSCSALDFEKKEVKVERNKNSVLNLVYFGRIVPEKGLLDFIKSLAISKIEYTFTMIGEGDDCDIINNYILQHDLKNRIAIKPKINHPDLFTELAKYDVFVLPSLWFENAPLSVIEAASLGLGLFLSHHGGVLEMGKICNATHFFNPFDPDDVVLKLEILYKDFLNNSLPKANLGNLHLLFSKEMYIKNMKNFLV